MCNLGGGYFGLMWALHADLVLADFKDFGIIGEVRCSGLFRHCSKCPFNFGYTEMIKRTLFQNGFKISEGFISCLYLS